jgi:hypothetical protein
MGKSGVTFCHQVAAWFPDMFSNFYLLKNHKIAKNSNTKDREKISTDLESSDFLKLFGEGLTKLKNNQILLNNISHRFLLTTKLFTRRKSLIVSILWPKESRQVKLW